jgi:hypothetical protein
MNTSTSQWLTPTTSHPTTWAAAAGARWRDLPARCAAQWRVGLALLVLSGLLLAFAQVVREGVRQGDLRRIAVASHADDLWRCNVISQRARRDSCRALLTPVATEGAAGTRAP